MGWNKVMAKINYKSGVFPAQAYADDSVCVGDKARIYVLSGYETDCVIVDIIKRNVTFDHKCARVLDKVDKPNNNTILKEEMIMFGAKTVEVKHVGSARTMVLATELELEVGQMVVYESDNGMHVGVVINTEPDTITASYWVIDIVDMTAHEARKAKAKQAAILKKKLDAKKKQFQDFELLRLIAASDPETATMLEEYTNLIGGK